MLALVFETSHHMTVENIWEWHIVALEDYLRQFINESISPIWFVSEPHHLRRYFLPIGNWFPLRFHDYGPISVQNRVRFRLQVFNNLNMTTFSDDKHPRPSSATFFSKCAGAKTTFPCPSPVVCYLYTTVNTLKVPGNSYKRVASDDSSRGEELFELPVLEFILK